MRVMDFWKVRQKMALQREEIRVCQWAIDNLKSIKDALYQQLEDQESYCSEQQSRLQSKLDRARRDADDARRQAESDQWHREEQIRKVTRDLERAQSYGDEYGIAEATRKMKRLV